jgi:hypothetical protein
MNILLHQYNLFNKIPLMIDYITTKNIMVYDKINEPNELINTPFYHYSEIEFIYDDNNLRIPYKDGKKIRAITIDLDDIYYYISSASSIPDNEIIYGEMIQKLADVVVGNSGSLFFNPNNPYFSKAMITIKDLNDISPYKSIFVFTHDLEDFYRKFEDQLSDKIIISHNSDHEIKYIKDVKLHLAQNCLIRDKKLVSLPIGIENNQWFDHKIFNRVRQMNIPKTKDVYFFFSLNTHQQRDNCYEILKNKYTWNNKKNKENYFKELKSHKYAICPRGNGLDTHRIWECLYLDVIPIIIEKDTVNIDQLPIIIVNNWEDLLKNNYKYNNNFQNINLNKITMSYYSKIISNTF